MTDVRISRTTLSPDPTVRAFAEAIADGIIAAGHKAAAHMASPSQFALPEGTSLEGSFLAYMRSRPLEVQQRVSAQSLQVLHDKQVKGLEGKDLSAAHPVLDLAMAKLAAGASSKTDASKIAVRRGEVHPMAGGRSTPGQLQFHLLSVQCIDETDGFWGSEAGEDEIALGGVMVDAGGNTLPIPRFKVGDFGSDGDIKNFNPPQLIGAMDFQAGTGWPKTFTMVLTLVEEDNGNFPELLQRLYDETRAKVVEKARQYGAELQGPALGEVIAAVVGWVLDKVFGWLKSWWEDDVFPPITVAFTFDSADARWGGQSQTQPLWMEWSGHGGRYKLWYVAKLAVAAEAPQAVGAVVYPDANFGGTSVTLPVGHYTLAQLRARGMENDTISSLKVGAGLRVIAYQHEGFAGAAKMFTGSVAYVGNDFNDQTSSIVVEPMRLMLFQHANYGGASQSFGPGRYDVGQLSIGNDQASSILVPPGYRVTLFQHAGFKGTQKVFAGDAVYVGNDFNDSVSSLIVELV